MPAARDGRLSFVPEDSLSFGPGWARGSRTMISLPAGPGYGLHRAAVISISCVPVSVPIQPTLGPVTTYLPV